VVVVDIVVPSDLIVEPRAWPNQRSGNTIANLTDRFFLVSLFILPKHSILYLLYLLSLSLSLSLSPNLQVRQSRDGLLSNRLSVRLSICLSVWPSGRLLARLAGLQLAAWLRAWLSLLAADSRQTAGHKGERGILSLCVSFSPVGQHEESAKKKGRPVWARPLCVQECVHCIVS